MKLLFTLFAALIVFGTTAQTVAPTIEFSDTDITKLSNFDADNITFLGLQKGMTKATAIQILNVLPQFNWKYDKWNTKSEDVNSLTETRIYVSLADEKDEPSILYLIWKDGSARMTSMVIYAPAEKYAKGDTKKLFTADAIAGNAGFLHFLKGQPQVIKKAYTTEYLYAEQHFSFTSYVDTENKQKVWFSFTD